MFPLCRSGFDKLPFCFLCSGKRFGCKDPTGGPKVFHGFFFLLAAEFGSTRIRGNYLSSGIAGVNGGNNRERERKREGENAN